MAGLCLLAGCSRQMGAQRADAVLPVLRVSGNAFVQADGDTIRLQGVSFSDPDKLEREGQWTLRYFQEARDWGCNVVRLPIHPYTWRYRGKENYLRLLDQGVEWARQMGLYVILDWHAIGNLPGDKYPHFNYATNWKETSGFWNLMATHFKGNPTVACYELFNEPMDVDGRLTWDEWQPLMLQLVDEIHAVDPEKICLVAGMDWAYELAPVLNKPVARPNVAYVTHPYPQKREKPWEPSWLQDFGCVADVYPVVATEFGFVHKGARGEHVPCVGDEEYGEAILHFFARKKMSYTIWCFDPDWAPALLDDYQFTPTLGQGVFFKQALNHERECRERGA